MVRSFLVLFTVAGVAACGGASTSSERAENPRSPSVSPTKPAEDPASPTTTNATRPTVASQCSEYLDTSIADGTEFPYVVQYEPSADTVRAGDRILVTEVRGTRPELEKGGTYLVRGEYTLDSATEATLLLSVTASRGGGCTKGNPRGSRRVTRGSGKFELAAPVPYDGKPHVTFYVEGANAGGVYLVK